MGKGVNAMRSFSSDFLNGNNANYVDQMYANWKADPQSVHASWDAYFTNLEAGVDPNLAFAAPSNLGVDGSKQPVVIIQGGGGGTEGSRTGGSGEQQER